MLQREFAQRLVAKPGEKVYCRLSVSIQLLARVDLIMRVGKNNFRPPPKVESNVVRIDPRRPRPDLNYAEWDGLLRICFARKNRTLLAEFKSDKVVEMLLKNYIIYCTLRNIENDCVTFDTMRTKVVQVLNESGYAKQRARKIDLNSLRIFFVTIEHLLLGNSR